MKASLIELVGRTSKILSEHMDMASLKGFSPSLHIAQTVAEPEGTRKSPDSTDMAKPRFFVAILSTKHIGLTSSGQLSLSQIFVSAL